MVGRPCRRSRAAVPLCRRPEEWTPTVVSSTGTNMLAGRSRADAHHCQHLLAPRGQCSDSVSIQVRPQLCSIYPRVVIRVPLDTASFCAMRLAPQLECSNGVTNLVYWPASISAHCRKRWQLQVARPASCGCGVFGLLTSCRHTPRGIHQCCSGS